MCGICGIVNKTPKLVGSRIHRMNDAQAHRGSDGEGYYLASESPWVAYAYTERLDIPTVCALGHRRLAIIDPEYGAQPMLSEDGSIAVLLNGELYNFQDVRNQLKEQGCLFKTDSDTEVLIHLYREHPDHPAEWLRQLNGIFSIAIWDQPRQRLLIARDPFGVKPLHYFSDGDHFLFASEIKALLAAGVKPRLNREALHIFMNVRYNPGTSTLFKDVYRLPSAHYAWIEGGQLRSLHRFYALPENQETFRGSTREDIKEEIRQTFQASIDRQLISDVPLGMGLSGGLDSSMIVAAVAQSYAQNDPLRTAGKTVRTFTLGFNEPTDENEDARIVADHFKTTHFDTRLTTHPLEEAQEVIRVVEEPKVNMLQGYALARFVQPHVKVLLGGLGGDELFAGYDIHRYCNTLGRLNKRIPCFVQNFLLSPLSQGLWNIQNRSRILKNEQYRIGGQIALSVGDRTQFYCRLRNAWDYDPGMYARIYADPNAFKDVSSTREFFTPYFEEGENYLEQVLRTEFQTKMVDDFLINEDRVTSAHGVEGRVPFLDKALVELAFSIPAAQKMSGTETKTLWKESTGHVLPASILNKKKQGFTFSSYHQWEKDLRTVVERELTPAWCAEVGLFNYAFIKQLLETPSHPNMRWHYFMAWMMLSVKEWIHVFNINE
ncbi:MAG: asparagine synthase (glutamine-hydrolyzing) [Kiritimatiellae bacterium]|nr:asparagine synthase (glutamine-hydrolyzing) [Kiritimatiellia bacterium]